MAPLAPSSELVARFRAHFEALADAPVKLGLAVSGGPDSLALLLLAAAAFPGRIAAATVDHGLRPESGWEALHVEDICARLGCPHAVLPASVPDGPAGLQGEARQARYHVLRGWAEREGIALLATAHHLDDQAETVLMRLSRGAGVRGLSGVRPLRRNGALTVVRPLLGWTKAELVHLVAASGIEAVQDLSNADPRFDRSAARRLLADHPAFDPARVARAATACREADEALEWAAEQLIEDRLTCQGGEWRLDPSGLPPELSRRLLLRTLAEVRQAHGLETDPPAGPGQDRLLQSLASGGSGTLAGVLARGGAVWHFRLAPPRRGAA